MRPALAILLALAPLSAQVARPVSAHARVNATLQAVPARVTLASLATLARGFDRNLRMFAVTDPIDVLGNTRGIYLDGFGAVFTTELSPILTPGLNPFQPNISEQDKAKIRQRKLDRIPAVEGLMNSMLQSAAKELSAVPEDQQIVVMVDFVYLPYENTSGLPGQMVVKATRHAILSGAQIEAKVTNQ
jgi:hypothetical protein